MLQSQLQLCVVTSLMGFSACVETYFVINETAKPQTHRKTKTACISVIIININHECLPIQWYWKTLRGAQKRDAYSRGCWESLQIAGTGYLRSSTRCWFYIYSRRCTYIHTYNIWYMVNRRYNAISLVSLFTCRTGLGTLEPDKARSSHHRASPWRPATRQAMEISVGHSRRVLAHGHWK